MVYIACMVQWMTEVSDPEMVRQKILDRIEAAGDGCWLWTGSLDRGGYGKIAIKGRSTGAHRASWLAFEGPLSEGQVLDHLCRVRHCVNPSHLEPVTNKENCQRGDVGKRERVTHCRHGHAYTPENTYTYTSKRGYVYRICKTCRLSNMRAFHGRKRQTRTP